MIRSVTDSHVAPMERSPSASLRTTGPGRRSGEAWGQRGRSALIEPMMPRAPAATGRRSVLAGGGCGRTGRPAAVAADGAACHPPLDVELEVGRAAVGVAEQPVGRAAAEPALRVRALAQARGGARRTCEHGTFVDF